MEVAGAVMEAGGAATWSDLVAAFPRVEVDAAIAEGHLVRLRGHYGLPGLDRDRAAATALDGVLDRLSAARHWGWKVKLPPERAQVLVPRGRNVPSQRRRGIDVRWGSPTEDERCAWG